MVLTEHVASKWMRKHATDAVEEQLRGQRFRHPETGNQVLFVSLPPEEQAKIRARYQQQVPQQEDGAGDSGSQLPAVQEKGPWTERVKNKVTELVEGGVTTGQNIIKFLSDKDYRKQVKEDFQAQKTDFKEKFGNEMRESKEMLATVDRMLSGQEVTDEERKVAFDQLKDIGKMAVLGTLIFAPIGPIDDILIFVVTAAIKTAVPEFTWMPSSWRSPIEASSGKDLADKLADRVYEGILRVLDEPSEELVLKTLDAMG